MKVTWLRSILALSLIVPACFLFTTSRAQAEIALDGIFANIEFVDLPAYTVWEGGRPIDIVGSTASSSSGTGRAKGNAYRVDINVVLNEVEFWLNFTSTQTLTYYVFDSPVEFGTYTEVYRDSETVTGFGAGWYSSGPLCIPLSAGQYYIIAVSWNGTLTYYYGSGDTQATSFGAHVHGYATGYDPLPASFQSTVNDQAIYHQRITTGGASPIDESTWGAIKSLFR